MYSMKNRTMEVRERRWNKATREGLAMRSLEPQARSRTCERESSARGAFDDMLAAESVGLEAFEVFGGGGGFLTAQI